MPTSAKKQVKVYYDPKAAKLTVWFAEDSGLQTITESNEDDWVVMRNDAGEVVGFKKLNYVVPDNERLMFAFEIVSY